MTSLFCAKWSEEIHREWMSSLLRDRPGISQEKVQKIKDLINKNEISKIENGKRGVGEKVAKRLAKALKINYRLLLEDNI